MTAPAVNVTNIAVLNNPTAFTNPFQFEITFECLNPLADDLEWKVTYVGCAESEKYDQELESILVGPVPVGMNKFVFQADSPDVSLIPPQDVLGVTVVLITGSYKAKSYISKAAKQAVLDRATPAEKEQLKCLTEEERNEKLAPFFFFAGAYLLWTKARYAWTHEIPGPSTVGRRVRILLYSFL